MEITVTIRGLMGAAEVARLQRVIEVLYPEARVRVMSGSHAPGPGEIKTPFEFETTAMEVGNGA